MYDFQVGEVPFDLNGLGGNSCHGLGHLLPKQLTRRKAKSVGQPFFKKLHFFDLKSGDFAHKFHTFRPSSSTLFIYPQILNSFSCKQMDSLGQFTTHFKAKVEPIDELFPWLPQQVLDRSL